MPKAIVHESKQRIRWGQLDGYGHVSVDHYAGLLMEHRAHAFRDDLGWDLKTVNSFPWALWIRRLDIEFLLPIIGDALITIRSSVREFNVIEAFIDFDIFIKTGAKTTHALMNAVCIDKATVRPMPWPADVMAKFYEKEPG